MNKKETIEKIKRAIEISKSISNKEILTLREIKMLELRFGLDDGITYTLEETGKIFGVTRERVRQIQEKAIKRSFALDK